MEMAQRELLPEGALVITNNQFAGRGQRGNSWQTSAGLNLTFSILLKPTFLSVKNQFALTLVASLSVFDFLKSKNINAKIKWPNDVYVDNKKICGMLIENSIQGTTINQSIVGIGLNINQKDFQIPTATSLSLVQQKDFDLNEELNSFITFFEKRYLQLRSGKQTELKEEYLQHLLSYNQKQKFISNENEFEGIIKNVNDLGELIVDVNGVEKSFSLKEIRFIL